MKRISSLLLKDTPSTTLPSLGLLGLRLILGSSMAIAHGWDKYHALQAGAGAHFPDPLGVGPTVSLLVIVVAELLCSVAIVLGLFTRAATIPWIATMFVIITVHLAGDPYAEREKALLYLAAALTLLFTGPGRFSLDWLVFGKRSAETESS